MRSIFGWDLPPGCTQRHIDEAFGDEGTCECCGHPADACICPECPQCRETGNPRCYAEHGLIKNKDQLIGLTKARIAQLEEELIENKQALSTLEEQP